MVLSGGQVPSPHNYLMDSAITHIYRSKKHKCQSAEKRTDLCLLSVSKHELGRFVTLETYLIKTTQLKRYARTCCRYIKDHLQYANVNLSSQMHKCRNSITGHSSITLQSSSVWIMVTVTAHHCNSKTSTIHHWTMFASKSTWIGECVLMPAGLCAIVSDDE